MNTPEANLSTSLATCLRALAAMLGAVFAWLVALSIILAVCAVIVISGLFVLPQKVFDAGRQAWRAAR